MYSNSHQAWLERAYQMAPQVSAGDALIRLFGWGYAEYHPDNQPHRHSFYEACYVANQTGRYQSAGRWYGLEAGDCFIARPGAVHQIVSDDVPMELYWVTFDWSRQSSLDRNEQSTARLMAEMGDADVVVAKDDGRVAGAWSALRSVASHPRHGAHAQVSCLASTIVVGLSQFMCQEPHLVDDVTSEMTDSTLIRHSVQYIQDNLSRPLSVTEVSSYVNLSTRHFSRLFPKVMGCSFVQFVNHARIEAAASLLRSTMLSIKEIAERCGYSDVHYFTRVFSRSIGITPARYRFTSGANGLKVQRPGIYV